MRVKVENLSYKYSAGLPFETAALKNISFELSGGFTSLIGRTGSGKSTLVQHLNGLIKPAEGRVLIEGVDINGGGAEARKVKKKIGMVFQYPESQLFEESVLKDVAFGPKNLGFSEKECVEKAEKALKTVGLSPKEKGPLSPFSLSGGEKRRAAIAGVLAMEPELLILDEPTAGLDPEGRREIFSLIENLRKEKNLTIILVTHDMEDAAELSDRVLVMSSGCLVMDGAPSEIFSREEELSSLGLSLPPAALFMKRLSLRGVAVRPGIITREGAKEEILRIFKKEQSEAFPERVK